MKWEYEYDPFYFDMWLVRQEGDRDFNSPRLFHFATKEQARQCADILNQSWCAAKEQS